MKKYENEWKSIIFYETQWEINENQWNFVKSNDTLMKIN